MPFNIVRQDEPFSEMLLRLIDIKDKEACKFISNEFRDGVLKSSARILIKSYRLFPISKAVIEMKKHQTVIEKLSEFFEKFFGVQ